MCSTIYIYYYVFYYFSYRQINSQRAALLLSELTAFVCVMFLKKYDRSYTAVQGNVLKSTSQFSACLLSYVNGLLLFRQSPKLKRFRRLMYT